MSLRLISCEGHASRKRPSSFLERPKESGLIGVLIFAGLGIDRSGREGYLGVTRMAIASARTIGGI